MRNQKIEAMLAEIDQRRMKMKAHEEAAMGWPASKRAALQEQHAIADLWDQIAEERRSQG
jgi:hypothetical protein